MSRDLPWLFDATIHIEPLTNRLHLVAYNNQGKVAHKHFPPATPLTELRNWLQSPATWESAEMVAKFSHDSVISYSHADGKVHLTTGRQERTFNPHSEESLASMVRLIQRLVPIPKDPDQAPLPNILPTPTPEQLAKAQVYTRTAGAKPTKTSTLKSELIMDAIISKFVSEL